MNDTDVFVPLMTQLDTDALFLLPHTYVGEFLLCKRNDRTFAQSVGCKQDVQLKVLFDLLILRLLDFSNVCLLYFMTCSEKMDHLQLLFRTVCGHICEGPTHWGGRWAFTFNGPHTN